MLTLIVAKILKIAQRVTQKVFRYNKFLATVLIEEYNVAWQQQDLGAHSYLNIFVTRLQLVKWLKPRNQQVEHCDLMQ